MGKEGCTVLPTWKWWNRPQKMDLFRKRPSSSSFQHYGSTSVSFWTKRLDANEKKKFENNRNRWDKEQTRYSNSFKCRDSGSRTRLVQIYWFNRAISNAIRKSFDHWFVNVSSSIMERFRVPRPDFSRNRSTMVHNDDFWVFQEQWRKKTALESTPFAQRSFFFSPY